MKIASKNAINSEGYQAVTLGRNPTNPSQILSNTIGKGGPANDTPARQSLCRIDLGPAAMK